MTNLKQDIKRYSTKLLECLVNLGNLGVPCIGAVYTSGSIIEFGTISSRKKIQKSIECSCKCSCMANNNDLWQDVFNSEQMYLVKNEKKTFEKSEIEELGVLNIAMSSTILQRLPAPLYLMNYKEIIYIRINI